MALSETFPLGRLDGWIRHRGKNTTPTYTQKEITQMIVIPPKDLDARVRIDTPAGTWHKDGTVAIFDAKPGEEIDKITKPTLKERLSKIGKVVFQMS